MGQTAKSKGSDFERRICKELSMWWTEGERDDIFWRTSMSGGRATIRHAAGKVTGMQFGDITAVDPDGAPLTNCITFELKRGYGKASPFDLLDANKTKTLEWSLFLQQAVKAHRSCCSVWWALVFQRDRRLTCVAFAEDMWRRRMCAPIDGIGHIERVLLRTEEESMVILKMSDFYTIFNRQWFLDVDADERWGHA